MRAEQIVFPNHNKMLAICDEVYFNPRVTVNVKKGKGDNYNESIVFG
jgi:hypothetical protein